MIISKEKKSIGTLTIMDAKVPADQLQIILKFLKVIIMN